MSASRELSFNKRLATGLLATGFIAAASIGSVASAGLTKVPVSQPATPSSGFSPTDATSPFSLVFQDDFDGLVIDPTAWSVFSGPGNGRNGPKAAVNSFVANGSLVLRAQPIAGTWYGAGVANARRVVQTYGKYEMQVRFDAGYGVRTAALLWPAGGGWPPEVDFYEIEGRDALRTTNMLTNHYRDAAGIHRMQHGFVKGDYTQWHTVGVEWRPTSLTYTLDGAVVKTMTTNVPQQPMWFGMNVSLGSPGYRPDATTPSHVDANIDWIKIYSYNGAG